MKSLLFGGPMKQATAAEHQLAIAVLAKRSTRKAIAAWLKAQGAKVRQITTLRTIGLSSWSKASFHEINALATFVAPSKPSIIRSNKGLL
jgi:hypothetical protein